MGEDGRFWEGNKIHAFLRVSRNRRKLGNAPFEELKGLGRRIDAVGSGSGHIHGSQVHDRRSFLPEKPDRVVANLRAPSARSLVEECADLGMTESGSCRLADGGA